MSILKWLLESDSDRLQHSLQDVTWQHAFMEQAPWAVSELETALQQHGAQLRNMSEPQRAERIDVIMKHIAQTTNINVHDLHDAWMQVHGEWPDTWVGHQLQEKWSKKYKRSIDCSHPRGFSQRAHCAARRKRQAGGKTKSRSVREQTTTIMEYSRSQPVIVVDVQPEYSGMWDGDENPVFEQIITFVNNQTGPVLMFVNAEDQGLTGDTVQDVRQYWEDSGFDPHNWSRVTIVDKGYGHLRSWMDQGIPSSTIIKTIRLMYQQRVNDSRDLVLPDNMDQRTPDIKEIDQAMEQMEHDPIFVNWISVAQLKKFSGAYIVGGGRNECLREVTLLMNAFNIKYKMIDSLLYENLRDWFKEKWVRFNPQGKIMGPCARGSSKEGKPKCLPQAKAHALGKKARAKAARRKRREDPNPERKGKAQNVATKESVCPHCGGELLDDQMLAEKRDACYYKVRRRYKVWPSAYASGALVQCRKKGAKNWGTGTTEESMQQHDMNPVHDFLHTLTPDDVGSHVVGNYRIRYEGFTDYCNQDAQARCDLPVGDPRRLEQFDDIYHEVIEDFIAQEHGAKPLETGLVGPQDNPIVYAVFALQLQENFKHSKAKITLYTDPDYHGAEVDDRVAIGKQLIRIPLSKLVGFEPDEKMASTKSMMTWKKMVKLIKAGKGNELPPILVRKYKDGYQVLDGHHRYHAYKAAGAKTIPAKVIPADEIEVIDKAPTNENFADGKGPGRKGDSLPITETREAAYKWLKSYLPTWPDYVLRDWMYNHFRGVWDASGDNPKTKIQRTLDREGMTPQTRWKFVPDFHFTFDSLHPDTVRRIKERQGGAANPYGIPKDAERHATQARLAAQQGGVRDEPVILKKVGNQYELIEGWHRTIQHFKQFPDGYKGPAWIALDAKPVSENFTDGMDPAWVPVNARPDRLSQVIKPQSQKLASWEKQDQIERNEYLQFVQSKLGGNWENAGAIWAKLKNRPADDVFGDAARLRQFMSYKFDFNQFDKKDWTNYWLLAQHCDKYRDFQKQALAVIEKYLGKDNSHYHYLSDRLSCAATGTQKYGTQDGCQRDLEENFHDGKGPGRPGDSQRHGIPKHATMAQLEKHAQRPGRAGQLARWQINMRRGRNKS
jgi:ParB-like nuclease domain